MKEELSLDHPIVQGCLSEVVSLFLKKRGGSSLLRNPLGVLGDWLGDIGSPLAEVFHHLAKIDYPMEGLDVDLKKAQRFPLKVWHEPYRIRIGFRGQRRFRVYRLEVENTVTGQGLALLETKRARKVK